jgi:hypothetical protein
MWFVAAAVIVGASPGVTPASGEVSTVPVRSGAELRLPRPSAWPCRRFVSAKLEALEGEEAEPYPGQEDDVSVEWKASGRRFRVAGRTFTGPLPAAALPRAMVLVSGSPHDRVRLSLSCNDNPDVASEAYDNERFKGVSWLCTAAGCRAKAGYPLPHRLARSSRRLRLCSTPRERETGDSYCDRRHRDVRPAFVDAGAATALARDILEDARRATDDACPSAMRSYQYAIGNTTFTVVQSMGMGTPPPPPTPYPYVVAPDGGMGTHIIFRGVTGSSFSLTVKPAGGAANSPRAPVNGFQIVSPSGS